MENREEVDSFEAKFNERLIDVEHRYNEEMINNNFRAKCIAVSQSFSYAGTEFEVLSLSLSPFFFFFFSVAFLLKVFSISSFEFQK